jgi:hypothetical protein
LSCGASYYAISAILIQLQNGKERPISFASRVFNKAEKNYSTTHKELLAVAFGTQVHRWYLCGRKFIIDRPCGTQMAYYGEKSSVYPVN